MRIAITGTHGTGKTTLARMLAKKLELPLITEAARHVAQEMGVTHAGELTRDKALARRFQRAVLREQIRAEINYPGWFVSDRSALDCWAYWMAYGLEANLRYEELCFSRSYDLLVYVPPEIPCRADGFRDTDAALRQLVDEYIKKSLALIPCPAIRVTGSLEERAAAVLEWFGGGGRCRPD